MSIYTITVDQEELIIDANTLNNLDMVEAGTSSFHLLQDNEAYDITVIDTDFLNKKLILAVNGNTYEISIENHYDQVVKQMGMLSNLSQKVNVVKAPMPGLILDIMVEEGQEIKEGTPLMILSAMKMENIILAQGPGIIKKIQVAKDDAVEKGQLIMDME